MAIRIELKISDQDVTPASFCPKKYNAETLDTIVYQAAALAKVPPSVLGKNAEKKESSLISLILHT